MTAMEPIIAADDNQMPSWLIGELRSDQAGETGAVEIYRGILAISKNPDVRAFAQHHMETEQKHLGIINTILPHEKRTRLLPVWRVMGFLTGALPALFGAKSVFATIEAVETFVDHHYQQQIDRLDAEALFPDIKETLIACQADEISHRDEAASLVEGSLNSLQKAWAWVVGVGSQSAVVVARKI